MFPRRIVALGSSSIHGHGDSELGGFINRFKLWHESKHPKNFVYGLGIFGETTSSLIERVSVEAKVRRPHLIVLYPGFNDIRREGDRDSSNAVPVSEFRKSMEILVDNSTEIAPTLMLTGFPFIESKATPYLDSDWHYLNSDAEIYMDELRSVCTDKSCLILDLFENWKTNNLEDLLAADGLHCNPSGHQKLAEDLQQFLEIQYS